MIKRVCSRCNEEKPTDAFGMDRNRIMARCRGCHDAAQRERWRSNPNAKTLDKAGRARRGDKIRAYDAMRSKRDRTKKREWQKQWRSNNPVRARHKSVEYQAKRRSRLKAVGGRSFSADDIAKIVSNQKGRCWWCLKKIEGTPAMDHRMPLARGGANGIDNIVASCSPCNRSKGAKTPIEFAGRLF